MSVEHRVWIEDGTLAGYATAHGDGLFEVNEADEASGYRWPEFKFSTMNEADSYAAEWAEGYAAWLRETCECGGYDCGVLNEHGVSTQRVEGS